MSRKPLRPLSPFQDSHSYSRQARSYQPYLLSSSVGEVDYPSPFVRAPIVYPDRHFLAVLQIGHLDDRAEGKVIVCSGQFVHVEDLARSRSPAVKARSVPARDPVFHPLMAARST